MPEIHLVQCFNCLSDFDALEAIWCSCDPQHPSKVCPFCLGCFCAAGQEFKEAFWRSAPPSMRNEVETLSRSRMLIGEMLVRAGLITTPQLLEALNRQKISGRRLGEILVETEALDMDRLQGFLQSQHTAIVVDLARARIDAMLLRRLGIDQCLRERMLPLEPEAFRDRHIMTLVMADPSNASAIDRVMKATGYQVIPGVAPGEAIVSAIRSIFPQGSATPSSEQRSEEQDPAPADPAPRKILLQAAGRRASHVQIQNRNGTTRVYYRIDGTLYLDRACPAADAAAALTGFKMIAGLGDDSKTVPRVGRAVVSLEGMDHWILVRTRPEREGEELSVKLLDPVGFPPHLDDLGLPGPVVERFRDILQKDSGLLVISAPPLSGASSTVYALAMEVAGQGRPLALVESPRAVNLTDVTQEEFFPEIRGSFGQALARAAASGARVVAVTPSTGVSFGGDLAKLAKRMLVICRVEARALPDALVRLVSDGCPPSLLGSGCAFVAHQRLVRRVCPSCSAVVSDAEEFASSLRLTAQEARELKLRRGSGCDDCGPTPGFRGRVALAHALTVTPKIAQAATSSVAAVAAACRAAGLVPMRTEALAALGAGRTTPEEITRKQMS